ncbi:MAG: phosphoribosylaminoimidazolesuccinocarboxamide synthase [Thermoguttaceae bacterium]|nr:phosphoribosylaminoimidazolesuccinocarboxamide synthase [Thermoguttaceae bacterium]
MNANVVLQTSIPGTTPKRGKVRDVYDFGDKILLVSSDRISAFDWILPTGVPDKGKVLNQTAEFWFETLGVPNHVVTTDVNEIPFPEGTDLSQFEGRSVLCKKTNVVMIECVVRGYLAGSGWKEYRESGTVCGIKLPEGLVESSKLPEPIFTPSTKETTGHDQNISFEECADRVGLDVATKLRDLSLDVFKRGSEYAAKRGIIVADTKFEFGFDDSGELILIDEVLTPDSSRFWPADLYEPGKGQPSFDKQFVRDWLLQSGWDRNSEPPQLPDEIVLKTREKYLEAFERLTDRKLKFQSDL